MSRRLPVDERAFQVTAAWIAAQQRADGAIPWVPGGKLDPWDHVQAAMALGAAGRVEAAKAAYRYLARTQGEDGAWPAGVQGERVVDPTRETNHAAYVATGLWHLYCARPDVDFLAELWPTVERAIAFVVSLADERGAVAWAKDERGNVWPAPLLTGCSSIYGSLVCAERIGAVLGEDRPQWTAVRRRLGALLRDGHEVFHRAPVPEPPGRHAMDWYYPVLGGALRGSPARTRLLEGRETYVVEGVGCRCVIDRPWYTVAETCELVIALEACALEDLAVEMFGWVHALRDEDGGYWTGITHPDGERWPEERPTWTAATVLLAADVLAGDSPTSAFFRDLDPGDDPSEPSAPAG